MKYCCRANCLVSVLFCSVWRRAFTRGPTGAAGRRGVLLPIGHPTFKSVCRAIEGNSFLQKLTDIQNSYSGRISPLKTRSLHWSRESKGGLQGECWGLHPAVCWDLPFTSRSESVKSPRVPTSWQACMYVQDMGWHARAGVMVSVRGEGSTSFHGLSKSVCFREEISLCRSHC